jgi:hypothetical protein
VALCVRAGNLVDETGEPQQLAAEKVLVHLHDVIGKRAQGRCGIIEWTFFRILSE